MRLLNNFSKKSDAVKDDGMYAELYSIATVSTCQGKGIGFALLDKLEHSLRMKSITRLSLTTDIYNNDRTIMF